MVCALEPLWQYSGAANVAQEKRIGRQPSNPTIVLLATCAMPRRSRSPLRRNRPAAFYDIQRSGHTLIDSQQRMEEHPSTWHAADWEEISAVRPGDSAKVGLQFSSGGGERFWTIVQDADGDTIRAEVNNHLVMRSDLPRCGDVILSRQIRCSVKCAPSAAALQCPAPCAAANRSAAAGGGYGRAGRW